MSSSRSHSLGDTSRTFLSKLEGGKSSLTLDKLEQVSQRLGVSSLTLLTLLTLTLGLESGRSSAELIDGLRLEIENLQREGGLTSLGERPHPGGVRLALNRPPARRSQVSV